MPTTVVDEVWEELVNRIGDDLRAVTGYNGTEYETRMREDVRARYTREEDWELIDQTIIDQFSERKVAEKFKTGKLHGTIRVFDDCWVVVWFHPEDFSAGILVSIQRDGARATIEDVERCLDYLSSEVEPSILEDIE